MPREWDSYAAQPSKLESVEGASDLLLVAMRDDSPAPHVVPTARGFVQLEWHRGGMDLEIEVHRPGELLASFENSATGEKWERTVAGDVGVLLPYIERLCRAE